MLSDRYTLQKYLLSSKTESKLWNIQIAKSYWISFVVLLTRAATLPYRLDKKAPITSMGS
jgi:hypothetical protein